MVIGGRTCPRCTQPWSNDIEIVSPDPVASPVPYCLSSLNPFPSGSIHNGEGSIMSESINWYTESPNKPLFVTYQMEFPSSVRVALEDHRHALGQENAIATSLGHKGRMHRTLCFHAPTYIQVNKTLRFHDLHLLITTQPCHVAI